MGICMWNTENAENTDYGQMGIAEDYLMWFSFMYGLQSDYYLVLLRSTYSTHSHLSLLVPCPVWTSICILSFLPLVLVTSDVCPTSLPVTLLKHTPTFIGIQHRLDMHMVTSD